jgi:oxygen-independent coproporphyrinogen-3 oxidase
MSGDARRLPNDPPTAAYVHVPFCRHRCGYCNFTLVAGRDDLIDSFLNAIERELATVDARYWLQTLYFGGGTPTHLPAEKLARLFKTVANTFDLMPGREITVEANPLDLDAARIALLKEFSVTRLSLGVQSLNDAKLAILERDHRRQEVLQSIQAAKRLQCDLSIDLIYGAPGETLDQWRDDLRQAIAAEPEHISIYGLTIEQGSAFYGRQRRGQLATAPEGVEVEMYEAAIDALSAAGYEHYEVSNFAAPGHRSRHNETYWRGQSYFAFGPGAARYVAGVRSMNHRSTTTYIARMLAGASPVAETEKLSPEDRARERLVFGLRMLEGIDAESFADETGFRIEELIGDQLQALLHQGLLRWSGAQLQLTRAGLLVSDSIWPNFL